MNGYSGSDIDRIVGLAAKSAARREREMRTKDKEYSTKILPIDIEDAIEATPRSVSRRDLEIYRNYKEMMSK